MAVNQSIQFDTNSNTDQRIQTFKLRRSGTYPTTSKFGTSKGEDARKVSVLVPVVASIYWRRRTASLSLARESFFKGRSATFPVLKPPKDVSHTRVQLICVRLCTKPCGSWIEVVRSEPVVIYPYAPNISIFGSLGFSASPTRI